MYLSYLRIKNHPILGDVDIDFINQDTGKPYSIIAFVGENGCGKTTLLDEIFNYDKSEYIYDKEGSYSIVPKPFDALYLRQGSLHKNAMKEVRKLIDGEDMYPVNSAVYSGGSNTYSLRSSNTLNTINEGIKLLETLGDKKITELFKENHIDDIWCSDQVSKRIDGIEHGFNISNLSSGQQELALKIRDIRKMSSGTDCVLLDEPETSLHPRWQKQILNIIRLMLTDSNGNIPQIFVATHSEKVLESLISFDDALIVGLSNDDNSIKSDTFDEMNLCLPTITFAELDYVLFHIPTMEYHDLLLTRVGNLYGVEAISDIDRTIKLHPLFNEETYRKNWVVKTKKGVNKYKTLPVYIRNYFHHPKEGLAPTEEEIVKSIEFLRTIIKNFKEQ